MADDEPMVVSQHVAERVRKFRRQRDWSQAELANQVSRLGVTMHQTAIDKVEKGKRRVTVDELLLFASALDVAPALLLVPLGEAEEVRVTPKESTHPHLAIEWIAGDKPLAYGEKRFSKNVEAWGRNNQTILLFHGLREYQNAAYRSATALITAIRMIDGSSPDDETSISLAVTHSGSPAVMEAQRLFDQALQRLDQHLDVMRQVVPSVPEMPADWQVRMAHLRADEG
jgi:transcriptional regulator with XRE-family HTH domain